MDRTTQTSPTTVVSGAITCNCADWERIVFSDESRFLLCPDDRRKRVWRRPGQRVDPGLTVEHHTGPQQGVMVWGAISFDSRTPLVVIPGTLTAQRWINEEKRHLLIVKQSCAIYRNKSLILKIIPELAKYRFLINQEKLIREVLQYLTTLREGSSTVFNNSPRGSSTVFNNSPGGSSTVFSNSPVRGHLSLKDTLALQIGVLYRETSPTTVVSGAITCNCADWERIVFSDESRFLLCPDDRRKRVWRRPGQRVDPGLTVEHHTGPQQGVMVWGAISFDSRTPLVVIPGTLTAQRTRGTGHDIHGCMDRSDLLYGQDITTINPEEDIHTDKTPQLAGIVIRVHGPI
ncbi:hypothetical protein LAZ67_2005222 [Cordylochernes scorpioides]|uniref:Transposable element Tcb1 transposase n=1 Tax=Cordylochernes scorpioides TaxID=51811 RepID=A0ABY6K7J2_9ARAC|nr:hypothetical protein LAZ67_2005222 [Cordylochernes scorpioides]